MNTLTYQKHVLFCLKLITFFYLNVISIVERQYIFKITMLKYLLFLFMYLYNIMTSKIKRCLFKIQNPVDLAFISILITVDQSHRIMLMFFSLFMFILAFLRVCKHPCTQIYTVANTIFTNITAWNPNNRNPRFTLKAV